MPGVVFPSRDRKGCSDPQGCALAVLGLACFSCPEYTGWQYECLRWRGVQGVCSSEDQTKSWGSRGGRAVGPWFLPCPKPN